MARSTHVEAAVCLLAACLLECGMVCARTVDVPAGKEVTLADALSGTEDLVKTGGGTLVLAGSTSGWTGPIDVREGTLSCSPLNMGAKGDLRVRAGAKILFTGTNVYVPTPTRKGYLAGTVAFASGFSYASNSWYVFKDAVLEDDLVLEGGGNFVGWGDLDMGGHVLSMGSGSISLPRMGIRNFGTIRKTAGGGLNFTDIKTTDFGSGGTVELSGGVTLYMRNSKGKTQFAIHSISGKNWIDAAQDDSVTTSTAVGDYTFAGPILIDAGSTLQTWSLHDGLEVCVIEGAITGSGVFSTAEQARTQTVLRDVLAREDRVRQCGRHAPRHGNRLVRRDGDEPPRRLLCGRARGPRAPFPRRVRPFPGREGRARRSRGAHRPWPQRDRPDGRKRPRRRLRVRTSSGGYGEELEAREDGCRHIAAAQPDRHGPGRTVGRDLFVVVLECQNSNRHENPNLEN